MSRRRLCRAGILCLPDPSDGSHLCPSMTLRDKEPGVNRLPSGLGAHLPDEKAKRALSPPQLPSQACEVDLPQAFVWATRSSAPRSDDACPAVAQLDRFLAGVEGVRIAGQECHEVAMSTHDLASDTILGNVAQCHVQVGSDLTERRVAHSLLPQASQGAADRCTDNAAR